MWCNGSRAIQDTIFRHQNPATCDGKKFLYFEPQNYGIGSMIHIAATALQHAICTGRILYLPKRSDILNMTLWKPQECKSSTLLCYFLPVTNCTLDESDAAEWPICNASTWMNADVQAARVVRTQVPSYPQGPCSFCDAPKRFPFPPEASKIVDAYVGSEAPLMAQITRYLIRPQQWLLYRISEFTANHFPVKQIPRPFASIHVRYGDKLTETARQPLSLYMDMLMASRPDIHHVVLSTETESVISYLRANYHSVVFYTFNYTRLEANNPGTLRKRNAVDEFIASFANLYVAMHADAFVGSLTSNWCRLIHEMERTRGDGGREYLSVDGSQFSRCFR